MPHKDCTAINADAYSMGERRDCTVRAIAVVTGLPYKQVHATCAKYGRKPRSGMYELHWKQAIESLGYRLVNCTEEILERGGKTTRTVVRVLSSQPHLVKSRRHLSGWNGTKLLDWADGRLKRVVRVYRVEKLNTKNPTATRTLQLLHNPRGVSVATLALSLDIDERAVRRQIDQLRRQGYAVKSLGKGLFRYI